MAAIEWDIVPPFLHEAFAPGTFQTLRAAQEFADLLASRLRAAIKAGQDGGVAAETAMADPFWNKWCSLLRQEMMVLSTWVGRCALRDWPIALPPFAPQLLALTKVVRRPFEWTPPLHSIWADAGVSSADTGRHHYAWWTVGYTAPTEPIPLSAVIHLFRSQVHLYRSQPVQVSPDGHAEDIRALQEARQGTLEGFNIMNREMERLSTIFIEGHLALARLRSVADGLEVFPGRDAGDGRDIQESTG